MISTTTMTAKMMMMMMMMMRKTKLCTTSVNSTYKRSDEKLKQLRTEYHTSLFVSRTRRDVSAQLVDKHTFSLCLFSETQQK